jgi:outer membrane protein OmpA-like peptidoglycan-associated protein
MPCNKSFFGVILTCFVAIAAVEGQVVDKEIKKLEKEAYGYFDIGEHHNALPLLLKLDSLKPGVPLTNFKIGVCFIESKNKKKSAPYFKKSAALEAELKEFTFYKAFSQHLNHEFDQAITGYLKCKKNLEEDKNLQKIISVAELDRLIANCNNGKHLVANPIPEFYIENLGKPINSEWSEYVPVISADETELIFTSKRPDTNGGGKDPEDGQYYEDVYISKRNDPTDPWSPPKNIGPSINTPGHDASVALSADGLELFLYRSSDARVGQLLAGDLYQSENRDGVWKEPFKLQTGINSEYWEPHASISSDEKVLYFSSNRPGGYGGLDIYIVRRLPDGKWALPQNLGPSINTPFDEDAPFIHPDANNNTLYFSSKGHNSMGGYDVFRTTYNPLTSEWTSPENIGYPINSADDDIYFVWSADGTRAYFSSIRDDSYGDLDIYIVNLPERSSSVMLVKGRIIDDETEEAVPAVITVRDNETAEVVGVYNPDVTNGSYKILLPLGKNYGISVDAENYLYYSENISLPNDLIYTQVIKDIRLSHILVGKQSILRNVFFDFNKSTLRKESEPELDKVAKLLTDNPKLIVEIGGHTDNIGSIEVNKKLSNDRAKSVVAYMISKGIDSTRIFPFGYGPDFPLVENVDDASRQLNRRTELIIMDNRRAKDLLAKHIGYYNEMKSQDSTFTLIGSYQAMKVVKGRALAYKKPDTVQEPDTSQIVAQKPKKEAEKSKPPTQRPSSSKDSTPSAEIELFFAFDKYDITRINAQKLDSLALLLTQKPSLSLVLNGFTDNVGDERYNEYLATLRLSSCVKYLLSKGVDKSQIKTEAFGERNPRYDNKSPEGRSKNRRVDARLEG